MTETTKDCQHCEAYRLELDQYEGLLDFVVLGLTKTISRQEWKIEKLKKELAELKAELGVDYESCRGEGTD